MKSVVNIAFLHHSTGSIIFRGTTSKIVYKVFKIGDMSKWFSNYNRNNGTHYTIENITFPKKEKYGWNNYPFDYYNIWVKHEGKTPYMDEPTLEILTEKYDLIVFKHCYPISDITPDTLKPDVDSDEKRIENYKLQYIRLKEKIKSFPNTKFLLWTGPSLTKESTTEEKAINIKKFFNWVKEQWDEPGDNIFLWDFFELETEGGIYIKDEYSINAHNPHPTPQFGNKVVPLLCNRIVNIIENKGDITTLTGL